MEAWSFEWSETFKRLYKSKDNSVKIIVDKKLSELETSDPYMKGKRKKGLPYSTEPYAIKVDKSNRIVYELVTSNGQKTIRLLKVCDHKTVYGHD